MHRWRSFGLVALTPLLVLLRVYCCDLRQQQCRNGIADCMTNANRLLGAFVLPCCSRSADAQSDETEMSQQSGFAAMAHALGSFAVLLNEFDERTKVQTGSLR